MGQKQTAAVKPDELSVILDSKIPQPNGPDTCY
jgi:hypothetical protein